MNSKIKKEYRLIFIGTPDFGLPSLKKLIKSEDFNVAAIITQVDKKIGRKQLISESPIKKEAKNNKIKVFQPNKIIEIKHEIKKIKPDFILVIAYGQIIPEEIINIPKFGSLNIHGSLLPKYRGASCVQAAILNGDKETGITIIKIDAGLDTGPIFYSKKINISKNETSETLYNTLSKLAAKNLTKILKKYLAGEIVPKKQTNYQANYVKKICKTNGEINWNKNAINIERLVRAMTPWPGAYSEIKNKKIKIIEVSSKIYNINNFKPGKIFNIDRKLFVQCSKNSIEIKKIQLEGKKPISAEMFISGYKKYIGQIFK